MAIKFEKIEVGMELLDMHRYKMGNTTMSKIGLWRVQIISIDRENRTVVASWNSNSPETYSEREITKFYTKETKAYRDQQARDTRYYK